MRDDDISSIRVQGGAVARLFQHNHFQGAAITLNKDNDCLTNFGFNDVVSSIQVY
jgi:hypothetical protein